MSQLVQLCFPNSISNAAVNNKNELIKNVRLTSFQNPQLRTVLILFKFVHPCVLVVFGCVVYTFLINVLRLIFMSHSS